MRSVRYSNRLVRKAVQSSDLEAFKIQLNKALSNQASSHSWPCFEQKAGPEVPSKLRHCVILRFSTETLVKSTQKLVAF